MPRLAPFTVLAAAILLVLSTLSGGAPAVASNSEPLFVNITTDDTHTTKMAIAFARKQQERKHPVTVFLNDQAVLVGAKSKAAVFEEHHALLQTIMRDGGHVLICPMCMEAYGVTTDDVIDGVRLGNPEMTGHLLFKDGTKTLTW